MFLHPGLVISQNPGMQEAFARHTSKARHTSLAFSVEVAPKQRQSPIIALVNPLGERKGDKGKHTSSNTFLRPFWVKAEHSTYLKRCQHQTRLSPFLSETRKESM